MLPCAAGLALASPWPDAAPRPDWSSRCFLCPQMGVARPQTLALALSLGTLSPSSNLCSSCETFDYRNLFLPHPALQHHADPQGIHRCPRHRNSSKHARLFGPSFSTACLHGLIHARRSKHTHDRALHPSAFLPCRERPNSRLACRLTFHPSPLHSLFLVLLPSSAVRVGFFLEVF